MDNTTRIPKTTNTPEGVSLTFITLNVRGLNKTTKRISIFKWLNEAKCDIAFLQETFCTKRFKPYFNQCAGGYHPDANAVIAQSILPKRSLHSAPN